MSQSARVFADAAWPASAENTFVRNALLAIAGSVLIAICAHIKIPMWPVPMTMQVFAVLLIGLAYGSRLGAATVLLYLAEGLVGLPVFAGGAGPAYMAGPTGGFLVGFVFAAGVAGWLAERGWGRPALQIFLAAVCGIAIIYLFGIPWLINFFMSAKGMAFDKAVSIAVLKGMTPFLVGDLIKAALAAAVLPVAWKLVGSIRNEKASGRNQS